MFKSVCSIIDNHFLRSSTDLSFNISNCIIQQSVRWRRKPRWLPVAKSKVFKVPTKVKIPEEEWKELKKLHDNYKTEMKSLRSYFAAKTKLMTTAPEVIAEQKRKEEEEHVNYLRINEEWNANVAKIRQARIEAGSVRKEEGILSQLEEHLRELARRRAQAEGLVRQHKEKSKTFITSENIDRAIEDALSTVEDNEFSIDLQGNVYKGRLTKHVEGQKISEILESKEEKFQVESSS